MNKPIKPKIKFKNFSEYMLYKIDTVRTLGNQYPCLECEGRKKVINPNEPPEYEIPWGKMTCPKCSGTGIGTITEWKDVYNKEMTSHKNNMARYKKNMGLYLSIKAKLTKEEWRYLSEQSFSNL